MTTLPQEPQISSEAAQAAQQHNLGALRAELVPAKRSMSFFGDKYKDMGDRVYEFEAGLVCQPAGQPPVAFRFDQITSVLQSSIRHYVNGIYTHTTFYYLLIYEGGATMRFGGEYREEALVPGWAKKLPGVTKHLGDALLPALGRAVCDYVSRARLPGALEALARGESLPFGDITVSAEGVQGETGVIPWSSIRAVEVKDGSVRIRPEGRSRPLSSAPVGTVPNLPLFMTLVERLRRADR